MSNTYTFSIIQNNILSVDDHGNGSVNISASNFTIPNPIAGLPTNLAQLITQVPNNYINFVYYLSPSGQVSSHDCYATYTLNVVGTLSNGTF